MDLTWENKTIYSDKVNQTVCVSDSNLVTVEEGFNVDLACARSNSIRVEDKESAAFVKVSLVAFDDVVQCSAVFTQSLCASPAVILSREATANNKIQALLVISKNAGLFSEKEFDDIHVIIDSVAKRLNINSQDICVACTGVIGSPLPTDNILNRISDLVSGLKKDGIDDVSDSILTTDKTAKKVTIRKGDIWIAAYAKGAGMIEPNMATMLVYAYTNFTCSDKKMQEMFKSACDLTLNCLSVDSDTSTSDTAIICSTGEQHSTNTFDSSEFESLLTALLLKLTHKIALEAEGATKLIEVEVACDYSPHDAKKIAKSIINSPLVKCAINGADPNWGRIVMAIGKVQLDSGVSNIEREDISICIQGEILYKNGIEKIQNLHQLSETIKQSKHIMVSVLIDSGRYKSKVWGCDLITDYVVENSAYTT